MGLEEQTLSLESLAIEDTDMPYEEDIFRNPYTTKAWLRYLDHKKRAPQYVRNQIYERALKQMPGSYKLWFRYLEERRLVAMALSPADPQRDEVNQVYERALIFMHKMPRIWIDYLEFLVAQRLITRTRRTFDAALRALPVTQHRRIWPLYISFVRSHHVPDTAVKVYKRYLMLEPNAAEEFAEYLVSVGRLDEGALQYAAVLNRDTFQSPSGKSPFQIWMALCELISKNPDHVTSLNAEAIIRSGLRKFSDMVGVLWNALADYYIRAANFEKARDVYEEAIQTVMTVRDFVHVFDAYSHFEEQTLAALMENADDDVLENVDIQLRMARFEDLIQRRGKLKSSVLLRQNPHNVEEWHNRVALYEEDGDPRGVIDVYTQAVQQVDPRKATHSPHTLWVAFAKFYEEHGEFDEARQVFERALQVPFVAVDDLASVYCEYAELELRHKQYTRALKVVQRGCAVPPIRALAPDEEISVQQRVHKSVKLWSLHADLEESLGTLDTTRAVYNRMLELRVITPQIVLNYATLLEESQYFEEAFSVYERGIAIFKWPVVFELWSAYLLRFTKRYGGSKLDRTRELFEQCLSGCPPSHARSLFLLYAAFEEEHGLARHAMAVYERATQAVLPTQKLEIWQMYIKRASTVFGVTYTRDLYHKAIEDLNDNEAKALCLEFADLERKLGEIDRARAIYAHGSQLADPRTDTQYWKAWQDFEVKHGNEDTFKEMRRIQRSVAASFNTSVNFSAALGAGQSLQPADSMTSLQNQVDAIKESQTRQFVKAGGSQQGTIPENTEEINLDDEEEEEPDKVNVEQMDVPSAVFGGVGDPSKLGAKARFQAKKN